MSQFDDSEEYETEDAVSLEHFRIIIDVLGGNGDAFDVELLYNKYLALVDGTEEDLERAIRALKTNQDYGTYRSFN